MSRSGQNGGGKGGRNYRLNWSATPDGGAAFGDWTIVPDPGFRLPWLLLYKGKPTLRAHGNCTGYRRFKTVENAERHVERKQR